MKGFLWLSQCQLRVASKVDQPAMQWPSILLSQWFISILHEWTLCHNDSFLYHHIAHSTIDLCFIAFGCYLFIQCLIISMINDYDIMLVLFCLLLACLHHVQNTVSSFIQFFFAYLSQFWWLFMILVWVINWFLNVATVHKFPVCHLEYCFIFAVTIRL